MDIKIKRKALWSVISLLIAALTIWLVLRGSGMSRTQLMQELYGARKRWLIPAALCMLGIIFFEGEAVLSIVRHAGYPRPHRRGFVYAAADVYFSAITPSASGGQPGSAFFMAQDGIPLAVVTASLLVNLIMYNAAILTIGMFCLLTRPYIFLHFQPVCKVLIVAGIFVLTGLGILFFMLLWKQETLFRLAMRLTDLLHRMHLMHHPEKWKEKLLHTMQEYKDCVRMMAGQKKMWALAYFFNVMQRLSQFCVSTFVYLAIGGRAGELFNLWVTQCFVSLGSNCVPIPGSMGVTDYLMLDGYMNLMSHDAAYSLQVISRGMSFYICILISALTVLAAYLLRKRHNRKKVQ